MTAPIVIAAGGTGGHFFPAEALASCLIERGHSVVLMTDARNNRISQGVFKDHPYYILPGGGIAGKGLIGKLRGGLRLLDGILKARTLLSSINPSVVVGFGGYPSIPPLMGTRLLPANRRPATVIHEGNAILGQANALLARFASAIATSYPSVARLPEGSNVHLTGMPVRPPIEALADVPYTPPETGAPIHLLVWGGSLGARVFSDVVPTALAALPSTLRSRLRVTQQINEHDLPSLQNLYAQSGIEADLHPFITNVADVLKQTHLVIGRAGGSSVAELTMSGRPSLLVPLPIAASDEQGANAHSLEQAGAGWMIRQPDFTPSRLSSMLETLFSQPERLHQAALAARQLQQCHAAEKLADVVESVARS
ncbi:undecaprenyldiphospho-muramoylpentapeptide beta-N-acetylglucosaminyltransferase [Saccharibacter sp. 17.LH.SD]|uniref:undecaprenyldiphospho-muramoylpentapeptide beta-N-acetylglucosaminyltransferase n=1 Tax=Saccharibacter sp. 17.LH.SD TaxID=2689393 RepID=UPI00136F5674|nr:undecaprenyldiphospho-muramoylpentapeptide beta-N-acetylglucosaminyltransferase [Saccharibacter sp. 17.LH.SD]MXV44671.1 undecaprenyldiphospho-muramoylpentapeptide beta-N-acetylglucosaminyltransferase [Saccharibacter sp. 17.LH.SD]